MRRARLPRGQRLSDETHVGVRFPVRGVLFEDLQKMTHGFHQALLVIGVDALG